MADSDFHHLISTALCLSLVLLILLSLKKMMDLTSFVIHLYKLADTFNPGAWLWFVTSVALPYPVACYVPERIGSCKYCFRGYSVHLSISARMFRCLRFTAIITFGRARLATWWCWFHLPRQDFHLQDGYDFLSHPG